ncbi:MAG: phosphoribosylformylglycinamidine cyclo-ligase [Oligoflexia bacterium]|nr:MAG: phosphoribosylformylglycinamidine cyclo-ligase [Oligoflexia bacterium]
MSVESNNPGKDLYKESGVDVEAGDALVDWLNESNSSKSKVPHADRIVSGIGGFASLFRIDFPEMKKPLLVTCTDGVGTKVKLASQYNRYDTVGQDCVAMCVNDLICTGGRPLMFLDYYATGKLDLKNAKDFLKGLRQACHDSDCALVGGETAEMPGVYHENDFDCAGFAVGVVDEPKAWGAHRVKSGDRLVGVSSSGFHSNGYSLLRKVFEKDMDQWIDQLLIPTALYVRLAQDLAGQVDVHAAAHITGGGMENVPRVLPPDLKWVRKNWEPPSLFQEVIRRTQISEEKLKNTLNCGIGFVFVVSAPDFEKTCSVIQKHRFKAYDLGSLE